MERVIKVTGRGKVSVVPTVVRIIITQSETKKDYEEAVKASVRAKKELTEAIKVIGLGSERLKTVYFNVDTRHESYQDKDNNWKQRLVGYEYTHRMKLKFERDSKMLGAVLQAFTKCKSNPEFEVEYTVRDTVAAKDELLHFAVIDSKRKAEVLTKAAGVKLGDIQSIDYSWEEIDFTVRPMGKMMLCENRSIDSSFDMDIEPEDLDLTDVVTVVWSIQ